MRNLKIKNNESGRSMIEMLGVLAIIGVLSVGGISGYSKAMQKYRINKTIEQITLIAGNVRTFFASQGNYAGLSSSDTGKAIIKKAKLVPDEMLTLSDDGTKIIAITNPFGGGVSLYATNKATNGDHQAFSIAYQIGDNIGACIELLSQDWSNAGVISFYIDCDYEIHLKTPVFLDDAIKHCYEEMTACKNYDGSIFVEFQFDNNLNSVVWQDVSWDN